MSLVDVLQARFPIVVPARAATLDGFRDWLIEERVEEPGRICYLDGDLFIDMSPEEIHPHNALRSEVCSCVYGLNKRWKKGTFYGNGILLTNRPARFSTEPDATFVLWETLNSGRATLPKSRSGECFELAGTPDWVLEIVSRATLVKDTHRLPALYHRAGIPEYWLISALSGEIDLQILRWREDGYKRVPVKDGWQRSPVFGCWFRLTRHRDRMGDWEYTLEVRE